MSYAIESKKRKFERILESLTDSAPATTHITTPIIATTSTASTAHSSVSDSSKRRRTTPSSNVLQAGSSTTSLTTHYLPSSRAAFLERLETFRNVTKWHIPSTTDINATEWAKRGWLCEDTDTVSCPSCKETVLVDLELREQAVVNQEHHEDGQNQDDEEDPFLIANAIYEGLVQRYHDIITTAHKDRCPWRRRGCDASIQRIENLLNSSHALSGLKTRYESIAESTEDIPKVAPLLSTESHHTKEQELKEIDLHLHQPANVDTMKLAVCGWQRKESDVVECRYCFRTLGLWLYRGDHPTLEQLDPIQSHLEYCPWRSPEAQDTEIAKGVTVAEGTQHPREKVAGWYLVYQAIVKENAKRKGPLPRNMTKEDSATENSVDRIELTPDQRDKKMKDLRQRIRDLKKPFNFKTLLRQRDKTRS